MLSHVWTIYAAAVSVSLGTPKTVIQYVAGTACPAEVLDFWVTQAPSNTSAMERMRLGKISAAGTGFTAGAVGTNIFRWGSPDDNFQGQLGSALTGTGVAVTPGEPTYSEVPREFSSNDLNGAPGGNLPWGPLWVPAGGIVGIRLAGIVAGTWDVGMIVHEFH